MGILFDLALSTFSSSTKTSLIKNFPDYFKNFLGILIQLLLDFKLSMNRRLFTESFI